MLRYALRRRFGVKEGGKIRCVDDFSWSGVNPAAQPLESPKPHTIDVIAGMMAAVMGQSDPNDLWKARSFDLKSAYRQCAVHPRSQQSPHIVVGDPNTLTLKCFRLKALPFGSVRSVHSFLRFSHSLWAILTSAFLVLNKNYFDDFVSLSSTEECASVDYTVKAVFKILACRFAEDGVKAPPVSEVLTALRISLDVSRLNKRFVIVDNTDNRRLELVKALDQVIESKRLPKMDALRLRGRMQFAAGQLFGRLPRRCLSLITQHAYNVES